ncbi:AbrB/MazE/SpoVT family DNA-binding domain-containing protein [archaeon]|jgi:AbrB family looped-hinge helix DNA binding protein|nr:AbrB/MazE/SpoVT family DNA-binding domain-containing protein [archaeon]
MKLLEIKSSKITPKGQFVIPSELRKKKGFQEGEKVAILTYEDKIEIRPLMKIKESMETAFASEKTLGKDWNKKEEDKAWKNL